MSLDTGCYECEYRAGHQKACRLGMIERLESTRDMLIRDLKWAVFSLEHGAHAHPTDIEIVKCNIALAEETKCKK